jgi:hypothetical protein
MEGTAMPARKEVVLIPHGATQLSGGTNGGYTSPTEGL